jgi:hypothetical protein
MSRPPPSSRTRLARGQVSWVTLALLLLVTGTVYLGWIWVPLYITDFQAKQVVRDYMNQAVKNRDDQRLLENMVARLRLLRQVEVPAADGGRVEVPAVDVSPADVTWERDTSASPPMLHVAFEYTRVVEYPFIDRFGEKVFTIDLSQDIEIPDWGPSR